MAKTRFFRVAVEGDTTDGRAITRQDIIDCAETFNPALYGVRINLEHFRGIVPGGPFDMLGDVTAVKAEEVEIPVGNVTQKVMGLFASIAPLPALVEINKKKQKLFSSIEIGQNCRGTGKAYLVGIATTDSPASFGTEALEFASKVAGYFSNRKLAEDNLICRSYEIPKEVFEPEQTEEAGMFASFKALFDKLNTRADAAGQTTTETPPPVAAAPPATPDGFTAIGAMIGQMAAGMDAFQQSMKGVTEKLTADFAALNTKVESLPASPFTIRPPATGEENAVRTDC